MRSFLCLCFVSVILATSTPNPAQSAPFEWVATLFGPDPTTNREFLKVSLDGDRLAVGAFRDDTLAEDAGAVYLFELVDGEWQFEAKLYASDWEPSAAFGASVMLKGDRLFVGASLEDGGSNAGAAYVFERRDGSWTEVTRISSPDCCFFGTDVDLEGNHAVVGAAWVHHSGSVRTGRAYIYEQSGESWIRIAQLQASDPSSGDTFGAVLDLDGNRLAVGAPSNPHGHDPLDSGAVYLFDRQPDGTWLQTQKLTSRGDTFFDQFGASVALDGDRLLVGSDRDNGTGRAYVFERDASGVWHEQALIAPASGILDARFGVSVALEGDRAVVGSSFEGPGTTYVFERDEVSGTWNEIARREAPDGEPGELFGMHVDLQNDRLAVAAMRTAAPSGELHAGAAFIFESSGPNLLIPHRAAASGETLKIPVTLDNQGQALAGVAFSVDFDESCLFFDSTDANADGVPDSVQFSTPPPFATTLFLDLGDTDGELDVVIAGAFASLPDGELMTIEFTTTCTPAAGTTILAPVIFGTNPAPSFSNTSGQTVPGTNEGGSIEILPGVRGDCNADGVIDVADVVSCELEAFDDDGTFWLDVAASDFTGDPVGCDANADTRVDIGDLTCKNRLIFGFECGEAGSGLAAPGVPLLEVPSTVNPIEGQVTVDVRLDSAGHQLTGVLFSLTWDRRALSFDTSDDDADGLPDAVRFVGSPTAVKRVRVDQSTGTLQVLAADLIESPRLLSDGVMLEVDFHASTTEPVVLPVSFSDQPPASFGTADGRSVAGRTRVGTPLFEDGFETGDSSRWSLEVP